MKFHKKLKYPLSLSDVVGITMLIHVKIPIIVGILTFLSRIKVMLSLVEYEKNITSGLASRFECLAEHHFSKITTRT